MSENRGVISSSLAGSDRSNVTRRHARQMNCLKSGILPESVIVSGRPNFNKMHVFSRDDLVEIRTLWKLGHGPAKICELGGNGSWNYRSVQTAVRRLHLNGGIVERKKGSGHPKTAVNAVNGPRVEALLVSPQGSPRTHRSARETAQRLDVSRAAVRRNAKAQGLQAFKKLLVHALRCTNQVKRKERRCFCCFSGFLATKSDRSSPLKRCKWPFFDS
ncbi:hypothetical protein L596_030393 [Steinernema carpocapsae]|uniref:Uncharacterized protein n=1 Tax=Steinernema carpocapsae TaxID=34508 RepID=A0A4U5LP96_STECR|nr:hypothetical protein L596_030393 [Steinernema carpocapsae]